MGGGGGPGVEWEANDSAFTSGAFLSNRHHQSVTSLLLILLLLLFPVLLAVERSLDPSLRGIPLAVCQYNPYGNLADLPKDAMRRMNDSNGEAGVW